MANIDLGNLTRYDGKIKQYAESKYFSKNTANWQMTEKAGAVTCYPVPDTELESIVDFSFKEIPPVSGDKSPTNPSSIQGVNSINITRCGKNLMPINTGFEGNIWGNEKDGITWTKISDAIIKGNGTASQNTGINLTPRLHLPIGCTYTYSAIDNNNTPSGVRGVIWQHGANFTPYDDGYGRTFLKVRHDSSDMLPSIYILGNSVLTNTIFKVQIELGDYKTEFESPASNAYTYSLGNTYYGGSVNLATGLMTVTHYGYAFTGTEEGWWERTEFENTVRFGAYGSSWGSIVQASKNRNTPVCSHFTLNYNYYLDTPHFYIGDTGNQYYFYPDHTLSREDWIAWLAQQYLAGHPLTTSFELATPYIVQLTPMQIKSLFALDKNTPRLNTLYTDADSIQVGYQKHPARTAYELENAILALGGGE